MVLYEVSIMKHVSNYTKDEFKELLENLPWYMVDIMYGYYHRETSVQLYAMSKNISVATLYRYKHKVERELKRRLR